MKHLAWIVWCVIGGLACGALAADWPQVRGVHRTGHTTETSGWTGDRWPTQKLWEVNVGLGSAGAIAAGGRVYTVGWHGANMRNPPPDMMGEDVLVCLDLKTGESIWQQRYPARYQPRTAAGDLRQYGGIHATPTLNTDTGLLYTLGHDGDLRCWNTHEAGQPVWAVQLHDQFTVATRPRTGGGDRDFGFTNSPLLYGDWVIIEVGDITRGTLAAFDQRTGQLAWVSEYRGHAGHTAGPAVVRVAGRDMLALLTLRQLVVIDLHPEKLGHTHAVYDWQTDWSCNIASPVAAGDNRVLITSEYNRKRLALLRITDEGRIEDVWQGRGYALLATPVVIGDRVFSLQHAVKATDMKTGEIIWQSGGFGHGSMIVTTDGKLIAFGQGELALIDPAADEYRELATVGNLMRGDCYPPLAMSDGVILCKNRLGLLVAIGVGEE